MSLARPPIVLGFLIFPGFPMACLTSAIEPLRAANEIVGRGAFGWRVVGETCARVPSSAAVNFDPDVALGAVEGLDYLFLLSGPTGGFADPRAGAGRLRRLDRAGVRLGAFSGGVFPLARAGLMHGHRCSVHWCYDAAFRAEFPGIAAADTVITIDRRRYTASGATAVFDLMLKFVADALGPEVMTEVACWFQHPFVRGEEVSQRVPTIRADSTADMLPFAVSQAIRLFAEHIEDPIQIADAAQAARVSTRHLERSFKRATGQSPLKYYRMMRLREARQRVLYSKDSLTEIALAAGFSSSAAMARHYKEMFASTPQSERRSVNMFRGGTVKADPGA